MDIVSVGECMVEMFCEGPIHKASQFTKAYGGDTLNTVVAASRLGSEVGFITRVGRDPFARFLLSSWEMEGVDLTFAPEVPGFNGIYFISLLDNGETEFTYYRPGSAASQLAPHDIDVSYVRGAKVLHTSGITQAISPTAREAASAAFRIARSEQTLTSLDPNLRLKLTTLREAKANLGELLPLTDIFLPSFEGEAELLFDGMGPERVIEHVMSIGVSHVVVKLGCEGCLVGSSDGIKRIEPCIRVEAVDTTGAGDAFNGGFLHGITHGLNAYEAAKLGMTVAGLKVRGRGAVLSLPGRQEVLEVLEDDPVSSW